MNVNQFFTSAPAYKYLFIFNFNYFLAAWNWLHSRWRVTYWLPSTEAPYSTTNCFMPVTVSHSIFYSRMTRSAPAKPCSLKVGTGCSAAQKETNTKHAAFGEVFSICTYWFFPRSVNLCSCQPIHPEFTCRIFLGNQVQWVAAAVLPSGAASPPQHARMEPLCCTHFHMCSSD